MSSEVKIERWVERRFWQEVRAGRSVAAAADAVGGSDSAGKRWFRNGGGMPTMSLAEPSARFLSMAEREEIAARVGRMSIRQIALELGRSPSTISRELARGAPGGLTARYRPSAAQRRAEERARRPKASKLASCPALRELVAGRLGGAARRVPGADLGPAEGGVPRR
jgi:hypothetical protein